MGRGGCGAVQFFAAFHGVGASRSRAFLLPRGIAGTVSRLRRASSGNLLGVAFNLHFLWRAGVYRCALSVCNPERSIKRVFKERPGIRVGRPAAAADRTGIVNADSLIGHSKSRQFLPTPTSTISG